MRDYRTGKAAELRLAWPSRLNQLPYLAKLYFSLLLLPEGLPNTRFEGLPMELFDEFDSQKC